MSLLVWLLVRLLVRLLIDAYRFMMLRNFMSVVVFVITGDGKLMTTLSLFFLSPRYNDDDNNVLIGDAETRHCLQCREARRSGQRRPLCCGVLSDRLSQGQPDGSVDSTRGRRGLGEVAS